MMPDPKANVTGSSASRMLLEGSEREDIIVRALQECQATIDAGESIDRETMLATYPEIRDELSACLEGLDLIGPLAKRGEDWHMSNIGHHVMTPLATLGDFRLVREIGRGGMGVIYEAVQLSIGRNVALKVLPYAAMLDKRQIARFQNEARAAATLEHPHIVPIYFVGNERGVYYYAMRLIDGKNLAEVLNQLHGSVDGTEPRVQPEARLAELRANESTGGTELHAAQADTVRAGDDSTSWASENGSRGGVYYQSIARLGKQVAEALDFAHIHGIIHRDIKPANIMLDDVGDAWITDFGLARIEAEGGMSMTGDLIGTLRYMSPEQTQIRRVTVDHRSDVYSLGATLYELLTLRPLFEGNDRASLLRKIAQDDPKAPSKIVPQIPRDLETIILKSIQKNPDDRYSTAQDFADDLQRFLSHEPVRARRTPLTQRFRMWTRRHPALVATSMFAVILSLISATVIGFLIATNERDAREQQAVATAEIEQALRDREEALDRAKRNLAIANEQHERADTAARETNAARLLAEANAEDLRHQVYVRDMRQAFDVWNKGWMDEVDSLLKKQVPTPQQTDYRGFEWHLLSKLTEQSPAIELIGHVGRVHDLAVFANGTRLASVGLDATIRIWNLETYREEYSLRDTRTSVPLIGKLSDALNRIEPTDNVLTSDYDTSLRALAVSPDGKKLATGNLVLSLWDLENQSLVRDLTVFPTRIFGVAFSPDGRLIAAHSSDEGIRVINTEGDLIKSEDTGNGAYRISFSPDGDLFVAPYQGTGDRKKSRGIRCWRVGDWSNAVDYPLNTTPRGCAFSSDGRFLACGGYYGNAFILNLESGKTTLELPVQRSRPSDIAISPDDRSLAVAYYDGTVAFAQLPAGWKENEDKRTVAPKALAVHDGAANAVQFVDRNRIVTCGDDGVIRISRMGESSAKIIVSDEQHYCRCRFRPHRNELLVATSNGIRRYDTQTWDMKNDVEFWGPNTVDLERVKILSLETSSDGDVLGVGNQEGEIVIFDLAQNRELHRIRQVDVRVSGVGDIAFSPDRKWMANASRDHTVRIRSTSDWREVHRIETKGWGVNVEFSADGLFLAYTDSDGDIAIVETETWNEVRRARAKSGLNEDTLRFTSDGTQLITGHTDSVIRVWNIDELVVVGELKGHRRSIETLDIHSDGTTLVSVGADETVRLWSLPTLTQIGVLESFKHAVWDCHFSTNGNQLAFAAAGPTESGCHIWDLSDGNNLVDQAVKE